MTATHSWPTATVARQLQTYSTDGQPAHRRIDYWHHITSSFLTTQYAVPVDRQKFCGRLTSLDLGELRLVELAASGATVTRTREHVGSSSQSIYLLRLVLNGIITLEQGGREACLHSGDFVLCDASRPYRMAFHDRSNVLILRIPRAGLLRYVGRPESMIGVGMPGSVGLSGLASRHLRELWSASSDLLAHNLTHRMSDMTMQLLATAYAAVPQAKVDRSLAIVGHRAQAIDLIERRLCDPTLSPSSIAEALRITPGYLHRVFSVEGETVARYLMRRRLEECAQSLQDPLQSARTITSIAFGLGFSSQPHFCRVFRERYGVTPGDYRRGFIA